MAIVRHSSMSLKQQRRPLPSLLSTVILLLWPLCRRTRMGGGGADPVRPGAGRPAWAAAGPGRPEVREYTVYTMV